MKRRLKKVLIIDDSFLIRSFFRRFFRDRPLYKLFEAQDIKTGLRLFKEKKPDLVVMDLKLPNGSGENALRRIRETADIPVIVLTGSDEFDEKEYTNTQFISKCEGISPVTSQIISLLEKE